MFDYGIAERDVEGPIAELLQTGGIAHDRMDICVFLGFSREVQGINLHVGAFRPAAMLPELIFAANVQDAQRPGKK